MQLFLWMGKVAITEAEWFCSPTTGASPCTCAFSRARNGAAVLAPLVPFLRGSRLSRPTLCSPHPPGPQCLPHSFKVLHLGSTLALSFGTMPCSDYPNLSLQSNRRILPKHTHTLLRNLCRVFFTHDLPTSGSNFSHPAHLLLSFPHSLRSSHTLNCGAKFTGFGIRQSACKSRLHHLPVVGPGQVSQLPPWRQ